MKKMLILFFSSVLCLSQTAFSQVKKQFKDDTFAQTTVIVKEDDASDLDILDELDLEDIGMGEQIRITTEAERPKPIAKPSPTPTPTPEPRVEELNKEAKKEVKATALVAQTAPVAEAPTPVDSFDNGTNTVRGKKASSTATTATATSKKANKKAKRAVKRSRSNKSTAKKTKRKRSRKRFKKKKRKSYKRKYSCYKF